MSEEKKTSPEEETEEKTASQDSSDVKDEPAAEPEKASDEKEKEKPEEKSEKDETGENETDSTESSDSESSKDTAANMDEKKPKKAPHADDAELKRLLSVDKTYRAGHTLYIIGVVLLFALILCHGAMFMLGIELFISGLYASWALFYLYVLPCLMMFAGLAMSASAAKKHGVGGNDKVGMAFVAIGAVLMITLGTLSLVSPSYRLYETTDLTLREGQPLKVVKYIPTGLFQPSLKKLPGEYCVDIYRIDGIFGKKLVSKQISFSGMNVITGNDNNTYILDIITVDGGGETIPFKYR